MVWGHNRIAAQVLLMCDASVAFAESSSSDVFCRSDQIQHSGVSALFCRRSDDTIPGSSVVSRGSRGAGLGSQRSPDGWE